MRTYICKCGETKSYGSMSPNPCMGCEICGTILRGMGFSSDSDYPKPEPHQWVEQLVETDEGKKPLTICRWCGKTKKEINDKKG